MPATGGDRCAPRGELGRRETQRHRGWAFRGTGVGWPFDPSRASRPHPAVLPSARGNDHEDLRAVHQRAIRTRRLQAHARCARPLDRRDDCANPRRQRGGRAAGRGGGPTCLRRRSLARVDRAGARPDPLQPGEDRPRAGRGAGRARDASTTASRSRSPSSTSPTSPPASSTTAASPPRSTARCCRCPTTPCALRCGSRSASPARSSRGTTRC